MLGKVLYFSVISLVALFSVSRAIRIYEGQKKDRMGKLYFMLCLLFALWCVLIIGANFSMSDFRIHTLYYVSEIVKMLTFITFYECIACITGYFEDNKNNVYRISSFYLYFSAAILFAELIIARDSVVQSNIGVYAVSKYHIWELLNAIYYISILFGLFYLVITYNESHKKKREQFAGYLFFGSCIFAFIAMIVEICGLCLASIYIPTVLIAFSVIVISFDYCIWYMRSIEYNADDYEEELSNKNNDNIMILNDEKNIIFRNKRLDIMLENARDSFDNKNIYDVFSFSNEEKNKLEKHKGIDSYIVRAEYIKNETPLVLLVKNKYDRYGIVFSSVVTVYGKEDYEAIYGKLPDNEKHNNIIADGRLDTDSNDVSNDASNDSNNNASIPAISDIIRDLQNDELIELIELLRRYYAEKNQILFELTLPGVEKCSDRIGSNSIKDLCERIRESIRLSGFDGIDSLMIELDRQNETIKAMRA